MAPPGQRRVAFSAKAKKKQLQSKREEKRHKGSNEVGSIQGGFKMSTILPYLSGETQSHQVQTDEMNKQKGKTSNRFNLKFHSDTKEEIEARKVQARIPFKSEPATCLELGSDAFFVPGLEFPKRVNWSYSMTQEMLDMRENRYFREYIEDIQKNFTLSEMNYFELNLETWRQLWRVLEMSDILLVIVDARFPSLLFPPSLYHYVMDELKKNMILVINKMDLVPASVLAAWKHYFYKEFPRIKIVLASSGSHPDPRKRHLNKQQTMRSSNEAAFQILQACEELCDGKVDLTSWRAKIQEDANFTDGQLSYLSADLNKMQNTESSTNAKECEFASVLTLGCIGQPNVGKSSLINTLMGKKVVSVSKTPGHTKHFQTIFLTSNVKLCDCPGLVFPSKCPRTWQVLTGSYPVAHLREPYSAVEFLAKYCNLPRLLKLTHPSETGEGSDTNDNWSAFDICEAWAIKRGFMTKRAARPDVARAANNLLRSALEGKICLHLYPPNYHSETTKWQSDEQTKHIQSMQSINSCSPSDTSSNSNDDSSDLESESESESESEASSESSEGELKSGNKFSLLTDE